MAGQGSARVSLREIDLSQVRSQEQLPQGVPAGVIGTAKKGPAFVPQTFATMQQFEEIFGSFSDLSTTSNSNRFGPLAMNEWMRNAQAGTYVRVLGVGDGTADALGAGFTVGQQLVQPNLANPGKLGNNPYATDRSSDGHVAGRTYFLGCFMKDKAGSSFLKDAGVTVDEAKASIEITFIGDSFPDSDSTLTLTSINAEGVEQVPVIFTFTTNGDKGDGTVEVATLDSQTDMLDALKTAIDNNGFTSEIDGNKITIEQNHPGSNGNTQIKATLSNDTKSSILIKGKETLTNSQSSATFQFREVSGLGTAVGSITAEDDQDITNTDSITIKGLTSNGSVSQVTYSFVDNLTSGEDLDFQYTAVTACEIKIPTAGATNTINNRTALTILESAISSNSLINGSNHNLFELISTARVNQTLTLTQSLPGLNDLGINGIVLTMTNAPFSSVAFATDVTNDQLESQVTFKFNGLPSEGDHIIIPSINGSGANARFNFVVDQNAAVNGDIDADGSSVKVSIIPDNIDATLFHFKQALESDNSILQGLTTNTVNTELNEINIKSNGDDPGVKSLEDNVQMTFNMSSNIVVTNPARQSLEGNFGEKTTTFSGGESLTAQPIIRGMLMMPQGVIPTLETGNNLSGNVSTNASEQQVRDVEITSSIGFNADNAARDKLKGYTLGAVSGSQTFELLLNGFSNLDQSAKLTCSFDPDSVNYFAKVLNTDPTRIEEFGHYLYAHWDVEGEISEPDNTGLSFANAELLGFCMPNVLDASRPNYEEFTSRYRTARSPWVVSQTFSGSESSRTDLSSSTCFKLFKLHALDDGEIGHQRYRVLVSNISLASRGGFGSFNLSLEAIGSDPVNGTPLIEWKNINLDPSSKNFIGRVIGDRHTYWDFSKSESRQRLVESGTYPVRNKFVRVEIHPDVTNMIIDQESLPAGFQGPSYVHTAISENFSDSLNQLTSGGSLNDAQVLPFPMVKSVSRLAAGSPESSSRLAWGVKFGIKRGLDAEYKELTEQEYNKSLSSWMKFYPDAGDHPVYVEDTSSNDSFQNNFFSLEKIYIPDLSSDKISSWDNAEYKRDGVAGSGGRFVVMSKDAKSTNVPYLKFRFFMQGGFDGVNIFDKEKATLSGVAALREGNDEANSNVFVGPTVSAYRKAVDVLKDKSTFELQLLAIPGIRESQVTDYAILACEDRFDAMLVMDIEEVDDSTDMNYITDKSVMPSALNTVAKFEERELDTSFAAAYFPDVVSFKPSDRSSIVVPPSVVMLGAISLNDSLADPWFAPAGLQRGRLNASDSRLRMPRSVLDQVYDADINPIYVPAGRSGEVYTFGQKTLLRDQSALDRINVRRLLINLRRRVRIVAEQLLFEPNRESTLNRFSQLVEPILAGVQARRGVTRYKVQIDTNTTTQFDIENNTIRGKIYLQPTKSVEFISLDFVVTNSINE